MPAILLAVGQGAFHLSSGSFCKALPLLSLDGEILESSDFPNDGEIWWMLAPHTAALAVPGRLIVAELEQAVAFQESDPYNSQYQIRRESPRTPDIDDGLEVLDVPSSALTDMFDLTAAGVKLSFDHPPVSHVLLRWNGGVYGPFDVRDCTKDNSRDWRVSLHAHDRNATVKRVPDDDFRAICGDALHELNVDVSMDDRPRHSQLRLAPFRYAYLTGPGYQRFLSCSGDVIDMEPVEQKLQRLSRDLLSRSKRQQLTALLKELPPLAERAESPDALLRLLTRVTDLQQRQDDALNRVCDALIQSGTLGHERIEEAKKRYVDAYIADRAAELQAQIQAQIDTLQTQLTGLSHELQNRRATETDALQRDLQQLRTKTYAELESERKTLTEEKLRLTQDRDILQKHLEDAALMLAESGDKVVSTFMTMVPLLQRTGLLSAAPATPSRGSGPVDEAAPVSRFELPPYVSAPRSPVDGVSEEQFFERFCAVVENSGYKYALLDLKRYHLSVKCSDLTVIGGPSGIGKTSLALLHARALRGADAESKRRDILVVNVNPSWMEVRDILGHMNTMEARFCPAETGLYEYLICAQEEYRRHSDGSSLYPVCLDEMNLAQVEHYFSDFLQLLEMPLEARVLSCFNGTTSGEGCAYRDWPTLTLPPGLRFIGTVNFDETTRRLSDRLLDRANLITIRAGQIPSAVAGSSVLAMSSGPRITHKVIKAWVRDAALPAGLAKLLDDCRKPLERMGVPLSARVYRGICRFVASAPPTLTHEQAFDVQMAQRVLSRIRNLVTPAHHDAFDQLGDLLRQSNVCGFDESLAFLDDIRDREQHADWQTGDLR